MSPNGGDHPPGRVLKGRAPPPSCVPHRVPSCPHRALAADSLELEQEVDPLNVDHFSCTPLVRGQGDGGDTQGHMGTCGDTVGMEDTGEVA